MNTGVASTDEIVCEDGDGWNIGIRIDALLNEDGLLWKEQIRIDASGNWSSPIIAAILQINDPPVISQKKNCKSILWDWLRSVQVDLLISVLEFTVDAIIGVYKSNSIE